MEENFLWFALSSSGKISFKELVQIINYSYDNNIGADEILSLTPEEFSNEFKMDVNKVEAALSSIKHNIIKQTYYELLKKNISFLHHRDKNYPLRVKNFYQFPPPLYCYGDVKLLDKKSIGISGSRNASEDGICNSYWLSALAVSQNLCVISGYARGVDEAAHSAALSNGGSTIIILPTGILNYWNQKFFFEDGESCCVVSMFPPQKKFSKWTAVERNHLIAALSDVVFIVEARIPSGSLIQGKISVKYGKPTFVFDSELDGNYYLLQHGAMPINISHAEKIFSSPDYFFPNIDFNCNKFEVTEIWDAKAV